MSAVPVFSFPRALHDLIAASVTGEGRRVLLTPKSDPTDPFLPENQVGKDVRPRFKAVKSQKNTSDGTGESHNDPFRWDIETMSTEMPFPGALNDEEPLYVVSRDDAIPGRVLIDLEFHPPRKPALLSHLRQYDTPRELFGIYGRLAYTRQVEDGMAPKAPSSFQAEAEAWFDAIGMPEYMCPMYGTESQQFDLDEHEIHTIVTQANVSRQRAVAALRKNKNVIDSILELTL